MGGKNGEKAGLKSDEDTPIPGKRKTEKDRGEGGFMVRVETEKKRQRAREKRRSGRETDEKRRFQAERVDGGLRQEEGGKMM